MLIGLKRMDKHPASGIERYFQSHPDPAKRVRDVEKKIQEIAAIKTGESINVVPDDNHKVHSTHIVKDLKRGEPKMMSDAQAGALR